MDKSDLTAPVPSEASTPALSQLEEAIKFYGDMQYERGMDGPTAPPGSFAESQRRLYLAMKAASSHTAALQASHARLLLGLKQAVYLIKGREHTNDLLVLIADAEKVTP